MEHAANDNEPGVLGVTMTVVGFGGWDRTLDAVFRCVVVEDGRMVMTPAVTMSFANTALPWPVSREEE